MRGLLTDVNMQGHLARLRERLQAVGLWEYLIEEGCRFVTFPDLGLAADLDDRRLWGYCQAEGYLLFTNNRNNDGRDSLQATMDDSWRPGMLPVITPSDQGRFVRDTPYASGVASSIANVLDDIRSGRPPDRPRIFVPT